MNTKFIKRIWIYIQIFVAAFSCSLGMFDMIIFGHVKNFSLYLFMLWLATFVIADMTKRSELHIIVTRGNGEDEDN